MKTDQRLNLMTALKEISEREEVMFTSTNFERRRKACQFYCISLALLQYLTSVFNHVVGQVETVKGGRFVPEERHRQLVGKLPESSDWLQFCAMTDHIGDLPSRFCNYCATNNTQLLR